MKKRSNSYRWRKNIAGTTTKVGWHGAHRPNKDFRVSAFQNFNSWTYRSNQVQESYTSWWFWIKVKKDKMKVKKVKAEFYIKKHLLTCLNEYLLIWQSQYNWQKRRLKLANITPPIWNGLPFIKKRILGCCCHQV